MEITIKTLDPNDKKMNCDIKLLLAESKHKTALKYVHGRYDPEKFWVLYQNERPVYFSHSHLLNVNNQKFYRLGSKNTQLYKHIPLTYNGEIQGRAKSPLFYISLYHQIQWVKKQSFNYPMVVTLFKHYNLDSPDSHRIYKLVVNNIFFGINSKCIVEADINKTQQCIFNVVEEEIESAYKAILKQIAVKVEYDI